MNVLFVCREKANAKISLITERQLNSLDGLVNITVFPIAGKGWTAYIKSIFSIRKFIQSHPTDIIHAHYSFSAYVASIASRKATVCSLMGSDIEDSLINRSIIRIFAKMFWKEVIVKSERLKHRLGISKAIVIPNGVDMDLFKPLSQAIARKKTGFDLNKKIILFLADPSRKEKNFTLAKIAFDLLRKKEDIELKTVFKVDHANIPEYISSSDVVLLTSIFEGSPNVIKEAMACNCPIVSTNVGDVKEVVENTEGCYITSFDPEDVAQKISLALDFNKRTNGREKIAHLDQKTIAKSIVALYHSMIKE